MRHAMTLEQAASQLRCSLRTVQRRVASGALETEMRDGRTMVLMDAPNGEAIAQLQRQADDTTKVAAMAAVTGERVRMALQDRCDDLSRRASEATAEARGWRRAALAFAGAGAATAVALSWMVAERGVTGDVLADMESRLERAELARDQLGAALAGVTARDVVAAIDAQLAQAEDGCTE